jgi:autotransporter strand-loop-strand O-heptosyltransferase
VNYALQNGKKVALHINTPALGDTIAAIPTLRKLSQAYGNTKLTVFTSKPFLFENHPLVDRAFSLDSKEKENYILHETFKPLAGIPHDLNGHKVEFRYSNMDLRQFHAVSLGFTLTEQEMEMDLYIEKEREVGFEDYVIIHPTYTWPTRTWDTQKWQELVDRLNAVGIPVVAVGRDGRETGFYDTEKPVMDINIRLGVNLLNDPSNDPAELRWMMNHRAKAVITMDSGILHVAGTTDVHIIQLGSSIDYKLRAPYRNGNQNYKYQFIGGGCDLFCSSNMKYNIKEHGSINGIPPQIKCLEDKPTFECHPTVDRVYNTVTKLYNLSELKTKTTKYRIKLVHLLLEDDLDPLRQKNSIKQLKQLEDRGIEYIQVWNKRWTEEIPLDTFSRPSEYDPKLITPAHYGCFRAFADGTVNNFTDDIDAIILCEGDVKLLQDLDTIISKIEQAYESMLSLDIDYFSFGSKYTLEGHVLQSLNFEVHGDIEVVNKVIGIQMIMFPQRVREYLLDIYKNEKWDAADIFLNRNFMEKKRIGIFNQSLTSQWDGLSVIQNEGRNFENYEKKKLLFIAPHLSTGGMPQFLLTRLQALQNQQDFEVYVVEYTQYSTDYTVQRKHIAELLGDRFYSLGYLNVEHKKDRCKRLQNFITNLKPDIIHIDECPEAFDSFNQLDEEFIKWLYSSEHNWRIIETCHNIWFEGSNKQYEPDAYAFCSSHHLYNQFKHNSAHKEVFEYPILNTIPSKEKKLSARKKLGMDLNNIHILNVGLWTPGKNQKEAIEIARAINDIYPDEYQFHFVGNQASNFEEYWKPIMENLPDNVTVWGERKDIDLFYKAADTFIFNSTFECSPLVLREAIGYGLTVFYRKLPQYKDIFDNYATELEDDLSRNVELLLKITKEPNRSTEFLPKYGLQTFALRHLDLYNQLWTLPKRGSKNNISISFEYGPKVEILGHHKKEYFVEFIDSRTGNVVHSDTIKNNMWTKCNKEYFIPWIIKIDGKEVHKFDVTDKKVKITFDSKSVGDTLAWMPQVVEFKNTFNCKVAVSTFHNEWFEGLPAYEDIEFVKPDTPYNAYAHFKIGWFRTDGKWDEGTKNPIQANTVPLIQAATDILGLPYKEVNHGIDFTPGERPIKQKYICIGPRSTAGLKEWPYQNWKELAKLLHKDGYKIVNLSYEGFEGPYIINKKGMGWKKTWNYLYYADLFIGLGSGLSWMNWVLGKHTLMINNFIPFGFEFTKNLTKLEDHSVCNSCWVKKEVNFDPGDWDWCPINKGTDKQHICQKSISADTVYKEFKKII